MCRRAQFQSQCVQTNETGRIVLVVFGSVAFHRGNLWTVKTLGALAAEDDSHGAD